MKGRKHRRVKLKLPIYVSLQDEIVKKLIPVESEDISEGGLRFQTRQELPLEADSRIVVSKLANLHPTAHIEGRIVAVHVIAPNQATNVGAGVGASDGRRQIADFTIEACPLALVVRRLRIGRRGSDGTQCGQRERAGEEVVHAVRNLLNERSYMMDGDPRGACKAGGVIERPRHGLFVG